MKIKIKIWPILILAFLIIGGIFFSFGNDVQAQAGAPGECDPKIIPVPNCTPCEKYDLSKIGCGQGWTCAFAEYYKSASSRYEQITCKKPNPGLNQCLIGEAGCNKCKQVIKEGTQVQIDIDSDPLKQDLKTADLYFSNKDVGCKTECLGTELENGMGEVIGADAYVCATADMGCGGFEYKDDKFKDVFCPPDKRCSQKTEDDLLIYYVKPDEVPNSPPDILTVQKRGVGVTAPAYDVRISKGTKAYCRDVAVATGCILEIDLGITTRSIISDVYADDDGDPSAAPPVPSSQEKVVNSLVPSYECKGEGIRAALRRGAWYIFNSTIGTLIVFVLGIVLTCVTYVLGFFLWTVSAFLEWAMGISQMDMGIVDAMWSFLRDFSNMFFILILLYIAFCTALRIQSQSLKKMLPVFMLAVIMVNFSKLFCQIFIDFSQVLIRGFYVLKPETGRILTYVVKAGGIDEQFFVGGIAGKSEFKDLIGAVGSQGLMVIYMLSAVITFGVAAILLVIRIITLWIMTAISPLIYVAMAMGQQGIVKKYWSTFLRTAFFAPVLIFCIVLSIQVLSKDLDKNIQSAAGKPEEILKEDITGQKILIQAGSFPRFVQMVFALAFIWAGIFVAKKSAVIGSSAVVGWGEKMVKGAAPWVTGALPAAYGLRALGRTAWTRALESKYGKGLALLSPTAWKMAYKARHERRMRETYAPLAQYLQPKMASWKGFWRGKGPSAEREKLYAYSQRAASVKEHEKLISQADVPTEMLYGRIDELLKQMEDRGWLGSEKALTPEVEAYLRVILSRGDINDLIKGSKMAYKIGGDLVTGGRAVMGADAQMMQRWFGNKEESAIFANVISEASKERYLQFAYPSVFDDWERLKLSKEDRDLADDKKNNEIVLEEKEGPSGEMRYIIDTAAFQKYIGKKAKKLGVGFKELYDLAIDNLGYTKEEISEDETGRVKKKIDQMKKAGQIKEDIDTNVFKEGIATVADTYHQTRNAIIRSEVVKKNPQRKWRMHMGSLLGDIPKEFLSPKQKKRYMEDFPASPTVKYFGMTPSSRAFIESTTWEDAEKIGSWADPRAIDALLYSQNKEDILKLAKKMDDENKGLTELAAVWGSLFKNLESKAKRERPRGMTDEEQAAAAEGTEARGAGEGI